MSGDDSALRDFCKAEYPRLVGALRVMCGRDGHLAEEVAQEAMSRLCRDWPRVVAGPSPRAWLYRVAFNVANSHWRRVAVRRRVEPRLVSSAHDVDHAETAADRIDLQRAVAQLSRRERSVLTLRFFVDMPVEQVAQTLGMGDPCAALAIGLSRNFEPRWRMT